jgi:hypothetical protein
LCRNCSLNRLLKKKQWREKEDDGETDTGYS